MSHAEDTVHRVDHPDGEVTYVISSMHCWIPGSYADERAAWYAFSFDEAVLCRLQREAAPGSITLAMLIAAREEERRKEHPEDYEEES
jgi:hypothetical protein